MGHEIWVVKTKGINSLALGYWAVDPWWLLVK